MFAFKTLLPLNEMHQTSFEHLISDTKRKPADPAGSIFERKVDSKDLHKKTSPLRFVGC